VPLRCVPVAKKWERRTRVTARQSNYSAMFDVLPLNAKLISSAGFTLEAPYGGTAHTVCAERQST
jgi:hypothetical protein